MAFGDVENLAVLQAAEAERKRRQDEQRLARDEAALERRVLEEKQAEAGGPAAQLKALQTSRAAVDPDVVRAAEEDTFLNQQAARRFDRQAQALEDRKARLAVPGPTAAERASTMLAPLGRFANEDPAIAAQELKLDRPGRLAALTETKENVLRDLGVSRETSDRPFMVGTGAGGEPYVTNLSPDELRDERRTANAIRERAGMEPLGHPRDFTRLRPGGTSLGGTQRPDDTSKEALLRGLDAMIGQAERAPLTPQERARDLTVQQSGWDERAARSDPETVLRDLDTEVGEGRLRPETGQMLKRRYLHLAERAYDPDTGEFLPEYWQGRLAAERPPAPGEAIGRAQAGGRAVPEAEQAKEDAIQSALQPPTNAPGTTESPSVKAESQAGGGFFSGLAGAAQRGTERLGGRAMPETPAGLPGPEDILRVAGPLAVAPLTGGLSFPAAAAAEAGAAGGSELLAQILGGDYSARGVGGAAALGGAGGLVARGAAPFIGRGLGAVTSLAKRMRPGAIPGAYGPGYGGAPTRVLGGLTEKAGAARPGMSTLERAQQGSAEAAANASAIPEGPLPYLRENLPALRGGGGAVPIGPAREPDEVLTIEDLIEQFLQQRQRQLPAPGL